MRRLDDVNFFFKADDGIRDYKVTGVQTCALPISCLDEACDVGQREQAREPAVPAHQQALQRRGRESRERVGERRVGVDASLEIGRASCRGRVWMKEEAAGLRRSGMRSDLHMVIWL